jgi:hypothetical protein
MRKYIMKGRSSMAFAAGEPSRPPSAAPDGGAADKMIVTPGGDIDPKMIKNMPDVDPKMIVTPPWPPTPPQPGNRQDQ